MLFRPAGQPPAAYGSTGGPTIINPARNLMLDQRDNRKTPKQASVAPCLSGLRVPMRR